MPAAPHPGNGWDDMGAAGDVGGVGRRTGMTRRLSPLTLDNLSDLPDPCRRCVLWELEPVAATR